MTRPAPDWLLRGEPGLCPCVPVGRRRRRGFVSRTLETATATVRHALFTEDVAALPGALQRLDPRVKLVTTIGLLVVVGLVHDPLVLVALYLATLGLAVASRIRLGYFVKRVWLFIPVFTGIVVLSATLSVVTPGDIVWTLWHWHGHAEGFTAQGLRGAGLIVVRVATSISLVVLLTLTTQWSRLLAALRSVGVPRMFVMIIGMAHRYLFLLLGTVADMYTARVARTVGGEKGGRSGRRFVAASAGALFGKAHVTAEETHQAMTARGYRGEARTLDVGSAGRADVVWVVGAVVVSVGALLVDRMLR